MANGLRRRSGEGLLAFFLCISAAHAQNSRSVQPVLICSPDSSCITFNDFAGTDASGLFGTRPSGDYADIIVSAPSGGLRVLIGANGGSSFGNLFLGPSVALEWPITRHLELDLKDNFSPVEEHIALGSGWANQVYAGGIVWLTQSVGVNGNVEHSQYRVSINKSAEYAAAGITLRKNIQGLPTRFSFDFVREFNNGIDATGTESAHLKAGQFNLDMRIGCAGPVCYRTTFDYKVGRVLTQSNPVCDGSYGGQPVTCPRTGASSGAFGATVAVEFPRRRAIEGLAF